MVDRVRPAVPGGSVTDATLVAALGACAATYAAQEEAAEAAKTARSAHSNELKKWKKQGVPLEPLKKAIKDRFLDPAEVLAELHMYVRLRALQNMPSIQQDLAALWTDIDLPNETKAEIDRQRWRDDGSFSARQGQPRDSNPHQAGSEAHQQWDRGWLNDQDRIARAMGAGEQPQPAVVQSRARPQRGRRAAAVEPAAAPPPPAAAPARRRRRAAELVH